MNKLIQNVKTPGWWSEPKNVATAIVGLAVVAGLGYGFLTYVLPWLVKVTWSMVNLIIAGVVCGFLLLTVTNRKFWRALKYFSEFIANYSIGLAIELNPFNILQAKIDQGYKDRNTLYKQAARLKGKQSELTEKVAEREKEMALNIQKVKILQGAVGAGAAVGARSGAGAGANRQISLCTNNVMRCREYIDNVSPIVSDLSKLIVFADLYYSVTTGLSAVTSAMRAFKGDDELNKDAEKALALLKMRIGEKIGHIKSAIDVTSRFMDDQVLEDKAKSAQAIELINQFDLGKDFHYSGTGGNAGGMGARDGGMDTHDGGTDTCDGGTGRLKDLSVEKYKELLD
jgi:hypothetical protein